MAVLVEGWSVVIQRWRIESVWPGGWEQFVKDCPNQTLCADDDLARVGFMATGDLEQYVRRLLEKGLIYQTNGNDQTIDFAVVDRHGPTWPSQWLEFGPMEIDGNLVLACRRVGSTDQVVATPQGWKFEHSLTRTGGRVTTEGLCEGKGFRFLRSEGTVDVYFSDLTGGEVFIGRTRQ